ncbi:hypothetical protein [Pseudomonas aeruginosa]|uniref:hypothetical protein n=1 Tax=Pseudomonas aeruginosa TaxID=287 RepID=UPI00053F294D|nr:hypothetical protein [Pseudomonas aeruginosa]WKD89648.1 hypothetical protein QY486_26645 [Pseudomonas aeruginosa]HBO3155639.1 hypothetical protein [Pseudomonas aeruginosa]HCF1108664.1 hypothetical protein [Pseudomonas aeruginosa]HDY9676351.1 hypothetical protein [Pseudomonas aeruginosa]HEJ1119593.1 hypothetical protein [Pseudomonas aeruginosa]
MTTLRQYRVDGHQAFVLEQLIPLIIGHARASGVPSKAVVLTSFVALATILQCEGMERSALLQTIETSQLNGRKTAEVLH